MLTCSEMRALEERAFADGIPAEALMEEAGAQIAEAVRQFFPRPGVCLAVFGKGHNGGDALVAARRLSEAGWSTHLVPAFPSDQWSQLTLKKFGEVGLGTHHAPGSLPQISGEPCVILDGLLGIGASGSLREPIAGLCAAINRQREKSNVHVFALDLPTGLNGDTGEPADGCVRADFTLMIGCAKKGAVADRATPYVGRIAVLPLTELSARMPSSEGSEEVATARELAALLPRRAFDSHKGDYGRIGIIAGSRGLSGAAIMAADACVRAGAGLVSLYVTEDIHTIVASAASPEVMVRPVGSYMEVLDAPRDVLAIGPGLGQSRREEVLELIRRYEQPMVIDADGLNILTTSPDTLAASAGPRLLTPHPGEMARLDREFAKRSRREAVEHWIANNPGTLLLKGSRTLIGERGRPLSYNSTGSAGMASGGMGDTLTGVCAALAGHGLSLYDAARLGAWLCGRAAEIAVSHGGESEESLRASRLLDFLGPAFRGLRAGEF